jgi:hypothetical protein
MEIFEDLLHIKLALSSGFPSQQWCSHNVISLLLLKHLNIYINTELTLILSIYRGESG